MRNKGQVDVSGTNRTKKKNKKKHSAARMNEGEGVVRHILYKNNGVQLDVNAYSATE